MRKRQDDGSRVVEQEFQRLVDQPQTHQPRIDHAVIAQDQFPGEDAQQIARPERDGQQHQPHEFCLLDAKRDEIRHGIGEQHGDERHHGGNLDGAVEQRAIGRPPEARGILRQRDLRVHGVAVLGPEAVQRQKHHGRRQGGEHDRQGRRQQQQAPRGIRPAVETNDPAFHEHASRCTDLPSKPPRGVTAPRDRPRGLRYSIAGPARTPRCRS